MASLEKVFTTGAFPPVVVEAHRAKLNDRRDSGAL
jgi:hypothetical protein